jgi:hypothetical protein
MRIAFRKFAAARKVRWQGDIRYLCIDVHSEVAKGQCDYDLVHIETKWVANAQLLLLAQQQQKNRS